MSKKCFKIKGFKFHQYALDILKEHVYDDVCPLHASAVAVYIGMVSEVSPSGMIPTDVKKSTLAKKMNMSRQTYNDGYKTLLERKLIKEVVINNETQVELTGYAAYNFDAAGKSKHLKGKNISYFEVANELFNTEVISDLVKSKEAKGLILMLDLFNHFSRELNRNKKDPVKAPDELLLSTLKEKLNKCSAYRVRKVIGMLSPLFSFIPEKVVEREPSSIHNPIRTMVTQIWIKKYKIYINPTCTTEKEATTVEDVEAAKAIKDAHYRISAMQLPLKQADKRGIGIAYSVFVRQIARFVKDVKLQQQLLRDSMQTALEELESYMKRKQVKSVGAYLNERLQQFSFSFLKENTGIVSDMIHHYHVTGADLPTVLKKYETYNA